MIEFKRINEDTDTKDLSMQYVAWDVVVYGESYAVYHIDGFTHTSGGGFSENAYYCCPISKMKCNNCANKDNEDIDHSKTDENMMKPCDVFSCCKNFKPKGKDLIAFDGEPCCWTIVTERENYCKSKWNIETIHKSPYKIIIKRNGVDFYSFICRDLHIGLARAQIILVDVGEHSISFNDRGYESLINGRKIFYNGYPAIIENYNKKLGAILVSSDTEVNGYLIGSSGEKQIDKIAIDLFDENIYWWRNEDDTDKWICNYKPIMMAFKQEKEE